MTVASKISAALFFALAASILALAIGCSVAIAAGAPAFLRLPFRLICHGIESRCLYVRGVPMPVCARCTGIYAGAMAGIAAFVLLPPLRRRPMPLLILGIVVVPLAVDGLTQAVGLRESTNALRLATGIPAGAAFLVWALGWIESHARPPGC